MPKIDIQLDIGENDYQPREFVDAVEFAEDQGFKTAWLGDHFFPWYHSAKRSAFVWSVLPVALERTSSIRLGPLVTVPIAARYHPGIIAQASATLDNMYPGRFLLGVGTGEALNERPFWNGRWPQWEERMERLVEGIKLMEMLWKRKEPFRFEGKYYSADFYYLYTRPSGKIPIYFSAMGKRASYYAGLCGDRLVTICPRNDAEKLKQVLLPEYRRGMRDAKRKEGGFVAHLHFTFQSPREFKKNEWRSLGIMKKDSWSIKDPIAVEKAGKKVTLDEMRQGVLFCTGWPDLVKKMQEYLDLGTREVCLVSGADKKQIKELADNLLSVF